MSEIDYEWMLRPLLAEHGVHSYAELTPLLAEHGVVLSESQVWRIFTGKPERLNLHTLMVLCDILGCTPNDLIERVELPASAKLGKRAVGESQVAEITPKPARIAGARRAPRS